MVNQILASPEVAAFLSGLVLTILWAAVGKAGRFLEAQGVSRGIVALVVVGKQLEALGYDGDKLRGKPGAVEVSAPTTVIVNNINAEVARAVEQALRTNKAGS